MPKDRELTEAENNLAVELRDYIRDRAAVEGQVFALPLVVFQAAVVLRWWVFGVHHNGRRMIRDERQPHRGYFREWMRSRKN